MEVVANILDPIHDTLPANVWIDAGAPSPKLKHQHRLWIERSVHRILKGAGYTNIDDWLSLVLTGSLTTYQYSEQSDCDVSIFVDAEAFPEWSRAEMIGLMVEKCDGLKLPGTPFQMQMFVVGKGITKATLYQPGLRSGYDLDTDKWINPPERSRVHNVEQEENAAWAYALESADKMERLLRYEPAKAVTYWHQIHMRRQRDQRAGKGDFSDSNIVYKFLANRGLFPEISQASGEYIAKTAWQQVDDGWWAADEGDKTNGSVVTEVDNMTHYLEDGRILPADELDRNAGHWDEIIKGWHESAAPIKVILQQRGMTDPKRAGDKGRAFWYDDKHNTIYLSKPGGVHVDMLNEFNLKDQPWQGIWSPDMGVQLPRGFFTPEQTKAVAEAIRPHLTPEEQNATDQSTQAQDTWDFEDFDPSVPRNQ